MQQSQSKTMTPAKTTKNPSNNVKLAILSYSEEWLSSFAKLVDSSGLAEQLNVVQGSLADHNDHQGDLVVAFLSQIDDIEKYLSDVSSIHLVKKIPVIALISSNRQREISERRGEVAAEFIMYTPVNPADFIRTIMTLVVSLKLKDQKKLKQTSSDRKAKPLGEILIEHQLITPLQLKKALDYQKDTGMLTGDALVVLGYITEEQKTHFLASQLGVDVAIPMQFASADLDIVALIPEHVARRNHCVALEKEGDRLTVTMTDVLNLQLLDNLRDITNLTINPILGNPEDIKTSIDRFYRDISSHQDASLLMADLDEDVEFVQKKELDDINLEDAEAAGAELGIVKLVNMLLKNAVRDKASDIHIEPQEKELVVRCRIDGDLRKVMSPPKNSHSAIITRIKILSNLNIAERRLPQDGRMVIKMGRREIDVRVSILPSVYGEKAVLRILDKEAFDINIKNLGFSQKNMDIFTSNITKPYGMVIVTGPTGSGKSTTLYSAIQTIKNVTKNIVTVEDPVEFHINGVTQVHVRSNIGLTFASSLRSILRQDPDIILIGEVRDAETADIAIKMALTGHLVFTTIHTNDAASSIARFIDIGIPPLLLGSSLNLIIAQRLVRKICSKCKIEYSPEKELIEQLVLEKKTGMKFYKGEGCVSCNGTGYSGRMGLYEMINVTKSIKKLILRNASTIEIQELAEKEGMHSLRTSGIERVLAGETTIEQVIAATTEI